MKFPSFLLLATLCCCPSVLSQDILWEEEATTKHLKKPLIESVMVVDPVTKHPTLLNIRKKTIDVYMFDEAFKLKDRFVLDNPKPFGSLTKKALGSSIDGSKIHLLYSDNSYSYFAFVTLNVKEKQPYFTEVDLSLRKETPISSFSHSNKCYLLTFTKKEEVLMLYVFDGSQTPMAKTFDIPDFFKSQLKKGEKQLMSEPTFIENGIPITMEDAGRENKIYCRNNKVVLTFNAIPLKTVVATIYLDSYDMHVKSYEQKAAGFRGDFQSNSFLLDNVLYQVAGGDDKLSISALDLDKDSLLVSHIITDANFEDFANSPITINKSGDGYYSLVDERQLEINERSLTRLLNKTTGRFNGIGIAAYQFPRHVLLTIGSLKAANVAVGGGGGSPGGIISTPYGAVSTPGTPSMGGFGSSERIVSRSFYSVLESPTLQHVSCRKPRSGYEKIKYYDAQHPNLVESHLITRYNGYYVWGYFSEITSSYYLRKVEDDPISE